MAKNMGSYQIYVIRCWEEQSFHASTSVYRFTLDVPATGQRFGFTRLEELIHALERALKQMQTQAIADDIPEHEPD